MIGKVTITNSKARKSASEHLTFHCNFLVWLVEKMAEVLDKSQFKKNQGNTELRSSNKCTIEPNHDASNFHWVILCLLLSFNCGIPLGASRPWYVEGDEHHSRRDERSQQSRSWITQVCGGRAWLLLCCKGNQTKEREGRCYRHDPQGCPRQI